MKWLDRIFNQFAELTQLVRTFFIDGMIFIALCARSRAALAAENLFLRKQLAMYQERNIKPRRFENVSRFMLVLLSRGVRGFGCSGDASVVRGDHGYHRNCAHSSEKWHETILAGVRSTLPMNSY